MKTASLLARPLFQSRVNSVNVSLLLVDDINFLIYF